MPSLTFDADLLNALSKSGDEAGLVGGALSEIGGFVQAASGFLAGEAGEARLITKTADLLIALEVMGSHFGRNPSPVARPVAGLTQAVKEARFLCGGALSSLCMVMDPKGAWVRPYVAKRVADLAASLRQVAEALDLSAVQQELSDKQVRLHQLYRGVNSSSLKNEPTT